MTRPYIGRFAPSPTGALHFGSLLAALASFLDARAHQGRWLVRIEDLDPPREVAGASTQILKTLERFGLHWDGEIRYQSQRLEHYQHQLEQLLEQQLAYPCYCSRQQISLRMAKVYDGFCRQHPCTDNSAPSAIRMQVEDRAIGFEDAIQGPQQQQLLSEVGDFVIRRKDGLFAYQLAVVIDDAEQQITDIIRGYDLLDSTPRQIYLQHKLGLPTPRYGHIPILVNELGQKLSKQTFACPIDPEHPQQALLQALKLLGQQPDSHLRKASTHEILDWATAHWRLDRIPGQPHLAESLLES